jgi:glucosamine-6-phosphate deaminase
MSQILKADLYRWCRVPAKELLGHPRLKVPFRIVANSAAMGRLMSQELLDVIEANNRQSLPTRAIIPCGRTAGTLRSRNW